MERVEGKRRGLESGGEMEESRVNKDWTYSAKVSLHY